MKKIALALIVAVIATLPIAFAVQLSVTATKAIGGTGQVSVISPADGAIESISWVLDSNAPYHVTGVKITWTPASSSATYTVRVTLYDDGNPPNVVGYGIATQTGSSSSVTTEITLDTAVDPADIYFVEVVIAET